MSRKIDNIALVVNLMRHEMRIDRGRYGGRTRRRVSREAVATTASHAFALASVPSGRPDADLPAEEVLERLVGPAEREDRAQRREVLDRTDGRNVSDRLNRGYVANREQEADRAIDEAGAAPGVVTEDSVDKPAQNGARHETRTPSRPRRTPAPRREGHAGDRCQAIRRPGRVRRRRLHRSPIAAGVSDVRMRGCHVQAMTGIGEARGGDPGEERRAAGAALPAEFQDALNSAVAELRLHDEPGSTQYAGDGPKVRRRNHQMTRGQGK